MANKHQLREVKEFGLQLLRTGDLDPIYIALYDAKLPRDQMYRLLLAYWCFYHLGVSAYLSEYTGDEYWDMMFVAAENKLAAEGWPIECHGGPRWPRGAERRHFRGKKCVDAVNRLSELGTPERLVRSLIGVADIRVSLQTIMAVIQTYPLFGPWIAFKAADMLERILEGPIVFPSDLTLIYKEPRAALDMLDIPADEANAELLQYFSAFPAPPRSGRMCNIQETETILCKWKSSLHGHYHIGKDIHEVSQGLIGWGDTAIRLRNYMPEEVEQGLFA